MRPAAALGAILAVLLSGCFGGDAGQPSQGNGTTTTNPGAGNTTTPPTSTSPPTTTVPPGTNPPPGNETPPPGSYPPWPSPDSATIRPGVEIQTAAGICTTNFVFRTPDNATLFLGTAAHCVDANEIGDAVTIEGASKPGTVFHSTWKALGYTSCVNDGVFANGSCLQDFALIAIDPTDRHRVSPAVLHFGGPTQLVDSQTLALGSRVLVYGNSPTWPDFVEPLHWHEGIVRSQGGPATFNVMTIPPGIPGDSGSALLTKQGAAAGILIGSPAVLGLVPTGENVIAGLQHALTILHDRNAAEVELVTWDVLNSGLPL